MSMLRGTDPNVTRAALAAILRNLEAQQIVVLLCGVRTHTNFGDEYKSAFAAMFSGLASEHNVLFYPAFDDAFVDDAQLKVLERGLHPNAAGIEAVVTRILPQVEALIDRARRRARRPSPTTATHCRRRRRGNGTFRTCRSSQRTSAMRVERKWLGHRRTGAIDPIATLAPRWEQASSRRVKSI